MVPLPLPFFAPLPVLRLSGTQTPSFCKLPQVVELVAPVASLLVLPYPHKTSEETKVKAIELGRYYKAAYNALIDANQAYLIVGTKESEEKVTAALIEYSKVLGQVLQYINEAIAKAKAIS